MRTVELHLDIDRIQAPVLKVQQAIGRLSMWGEGSFPTVKIFNDGDNDMVATYHDSEGVRKYVIGAVWRPSSNEYTFHS